MKTNFTQTTRTAIAAALNFVNGGVISPPLPDWTKGFDFFSKYTTSGKFHGDNMEMVYIEYCFYVKGKLVLKVRLEAVSFNADEHGEFKPCLYFFRYKADKSWYSFGAETEE